MTFTTDFLDETSEILAALDPTRSRPSPLGSPTCASAAGDSSSSASVVPRARRTRGQRLPQAVRVRGVRADRQRVRADGADQRRGVGHGVRRVAAGFDGSGRTTRCWSSRSAAEAASRTSRPTSSRRSSTPGDRARPSTASSAETVGSPRREADACVVIPPLFADASPRTPKVSPPWSGICSCRIPHWRRTRDEVGIALMTSIAIRRRRRCRIHRRSRRRPAARRRRRRAGDRVRQLLVRSDVAPRASRDDARLHDRRSRRQGPRRPRRGRWPATTRSSTSRRTPTSPGRRPSPTSTSGRARSSPTRSSRRRAAVPVENDPLRLGQRCLRRPRRGRGASRTGAVRAGLDLRCIEARRRGAHRVVLPHVRPPRPGIPIRQRRRSAPDARGRVRLPAAAARRIPTRSTSSVTGRQSKIYVHVDDVLDAVFLADVAATAPFDGFNVATGDYITVTEIAELAIEVAGLDPVDGRARLHRRRSRMEGRRPGRSARHVEDHGRSDGPTRATAARRSRAASWIDVRRLRDRLDVTNDGGRSSSTVTA